jgi:phosphatidylglycerophosphatase A
MKERLARVIATWFGAGYVPKAPGTAGSVAAIPLYLLVAHLGAWYHFGTTVVVTAVGVWASGVVERQLGTKDPQIIVVDEVAGMLVGLLAAGSPSLATIGVAFVAFRLFDSLKPWPIRYLERLPGGAGVMFDDVGAGILTAFVVLFLRFVGVLS